MYIIILNYHKPANDLEKYLCNHREYLNRQRNDGVFILAGRKKRSNGGVIVANGSILISELKKILNEDPFHENGLSSYEIVEFTASTYHSSLFNMI